MPHNLEHIEPTSHSRGVGLGCLDFGGDFSSLAFGGFDFGGDHRGSGAKAEGKRGAGARDRHFEPFILLHILLHRCRGQVPALHSPGVERSKHTSKQASRPQIVKQKDADKPTRHKTQKSPQNTTTKQHSPQETKHAHIQHAFNNSVASLPPSFSELRRPSFRRSRNSTKCNPSRVSQDGTRHCF